MTASFTLPSPPSVNQLYTNVSGRGRVKTNRYRTWLQSAAIALRAAKPGRVLGDYQISIRVPMDRRRDADGFAKATIDLLVKHGVTDDDRNMMKLVIEREARNSKTVHVTVEPYHVADVMEAA